MGHANVLCKFVLMRLKDAAGQANLIGPVIVRHYPNYQFLVSASQVAGPSVRLQLPDYGRIQVIQ